MPRYVALLRAINVGGHTVTMARLRGLVEELGVRDVATFIASGNVRFASRGTPPGLERKIEAHLHQALGYAVATFVRTPAELAAAAAYRAEGAEGEGVSLSVGFTREAPPPAARRALAALATPADALHVHGREVYWVCQGSIGKSAMSGARVERALGMPITFRSISSLRKLVAWAAKPGQGG